MLRWIGNALASSVGRKTVVGLTGLLLVGFLASHLAGNLKLFDDSGESFDGYVAYLKGFGPLLLAAELGLAALFVCHAFLALRLTLENRQARGRGYEVRNHRGARTFGSVSMFATGAIVLAFLLKHLYDFRFDERFHEDPYGRAAETLAQPGTALIYMIASIVVGVHLSHGFQSAFQTFGASHPKLSPILKHVGIGVSVVFAAGFLSIPAYFLFVKSS